MPKANFIQHAKALFRERPRWKARELAERMECSERTAARCVKHLGEEERWPIEAGKDGYFLREASRAELRLTDPREIAALAMAYDALLKLGSSELAVRVRGELMRLCRESEDLGNAGWENLGRTIHGGKPSGAVVNEALHGRMTLAMLQRQVVLLRYRRLEHDEDFPVKVFPHKWILRDQCWYLIAEDLERGGQRAYALPRISGMTVVARPEGFVEPVFEDRYEDAFGIWTPFGGSAALHEVCVELSGYWGRIARERIWHHSQRLEEISPDIVRLHFRVNELVEVKSWVLKFGGAAKVLAPDKLRAMVCEELHAMNGIYK